MASFLTSLVEDIAHDMRLHGSDFLPDTTEAHSLKNSLKEQGESIQTLDIQISSLETLLDELRARRVTLTQSCVVKQALLAPVRKLPPETMGEIFGLVKPKSQSSEDRCPITSDSPPLLLGRVCRKWRRVALGTPQLWTTIDIHWKSELTSKVNPLTLIPEWLRRSGSLPLEIYLGEGTDRLSASLFPKAYDTSLRSMRDNFYRCTTFHAVDSHILANLFPPGQQTDASSLREFRILPSPSPQTHLYEVGKIVAPNLASMDIYRPHTIFNAIMMDYALLRTLRWDAGLSSMDGDSTLKALLEALRLCCNLEECAIVLPSRADSTSVDAKRVSLPRLRRLSLTFAVNAEPGDLFGLLEAPALESITLQQMSVSRVFELWTALHTSISTTYPALKVLSLTRIILSREDVLPISALSSLESLHLDSCFLHEDFLVALIAGNEEQPSSWILPRLSSLSLAKTGCEIQLLVRIIESRAKAGPHLTAVSFTGYRLSELDKGNLMELPATHKWLHIEEK